MSGSPFGVAAGRLMQLPSARIDGYERRASTTVESTDNIGEPTADISTVGSPELSQNKSLTVLNERRSTASFQAGDVTSASIESFKHTKLKMKVPEYNVTFRRLVR